MAYFGLKLGQDLRNRVEHPYQFQGVTTPTPPPPTRPMYNLSKNFSKGCIYEYIYEVVPSQCFQHVSTNFDLLMTAKPSPLTFWRRFIMREGVGLANERGSEATFEGNNPKTT